MKQFAIIGLGRFGSSVAQSLYQMNHEVLGIDLSETLVEEAMTENMVSQSMCLDSTNIHALEDLGLQDFDTVVVAIGENLENSILTALNLMELKVPAERLIVKANSQVHGRILSRLGIQHVVYPEQDMGVRVAKSIAQNLVLDEIELDPNCSIVGIRAPQFMDQKTVLELNLRANYGVSIVAIRCQSQNGSHVPAPDTVIAKGDHLYLIGDTRQVKKIIDDPKRAS